MASTSFERRSRRGVCACQSLFPRLLMSCTKTIFNNAKKGAGGSWTHGWHEPTKTHPCRRDTKPDQSGVPANFLKLWKPRPSYPCSTIQVTPTLSPFGLQVKVYNATGNVLAKVGLHPELSSCEQFSKCVYVCVSVPSSFCARIYIYIYNAYQSLGQNSGQKS